MNGTPLPAYGRLSPTRERRAKELLTSQLEENMSVADVATACGLSRTHFTRAFRQTTGTTPHQWVQQFKVDRVKQMLRCTALPIAEVAAACGFADQSHLTRTFRRRVGLTPAVWRRR